MVEQNTRGEESTLNNRFDTVETVLGTKGFRDTNPASSRHCVVESTTRENALGAHTAYELEPGDVSQPYSEPSYVPLQHAPFAQHAFWVTQYRDGELSSVGDYPNQAPATRASTSARTARASTTATSWCVGRPRSRTAPVSRTSR